MKFVDASSANITYRTSELYKFLCQFLDSDYDTAEVVDYHYTSAYSAQSAINACAKRFHLGVECRVRKGKVYLIRRS